MSNKELHPQTVQNALNALDNSHTDIHRAIQALKEERVVESKRLAAAAISNALSMGQLPFQVSRYCTHNVYERLD
ncbi:hypothetical protein [Kamptonema sp. UHCC 0994]|uniref:hypothetical protein n=1 Tax=Kamptonema sp. UHCC 0994 TaxID=3031329 RepID=UPI0023B9A7C9|nr:hypothetical protein [Kamptonema sp. UHCC 0994]MDF0553127.1 hypothetical protein [Kamptonema sp. UHCC 0994]